MPVLSAVTWSTDIWALSPSVWPWPTNRKIYCQKSALEGLYYSICRLSLYSPGAHNIILNMLNWIPKMMVQFSTLSLSLPPIPYFFQATSQISQGSAIQVYLVLDYTPTLPPPTLPEKVWLDAVWCSYCITEEIEQGRGGTYRDLDWRRGNLVQLKHFQASRSVNNALHIHGR